LKLSAILVGILLLVLFGACSVQAFAEVDFMGFKFSLPNPFYPIGNISIVTVFGYALTIRILILVFAVIVLLLGILGK